MKRTRFFALFLSLCLLLTACGAAPAEDDGVFHRAVSSNGAAQMDAAEIPFETAASPELKAEGTAVSAPARTDRKLITTVEIEAETEHYDDLTAALEEQIGALGGYTEARRTGTYGKTRRWSQMTIRIPAENLQGFVSQVKEQANVLSTSEQTQDVTLQYTDTEAKITALETEQTRLLELLAGANNLSEILEIEARLSDVTYELERYESRKRGYDNQITYATVTLYVQQVQTLTPVEEPTILSRISTGFRSSLEGVCDGIVDIFVYLIAGSPYIVVCGTILGLILAIARKQSRKGQKNRQSSPSENP